MNPRRRHAGFTLLELLIAMTITLVGLGIAMTALSNVSQMSEAATLLTDTNQSLRASMNIVTRDLISAGRLVPVGGVPVPSGAGASTLARPGPDGTALTFPAGAVTMAAITPGDGLGPAINGTNTDIVTMLMVDTTPLCGTALALNDRVLTSVAGDGSAITVDPATPIDCPEDAIAPGDLIMVINGLGSAMQMVTSVGGQTIQFATGDPMGLNERGAAQGTILLLQDGPSSFPPTTAYRVVMISYYVDAAVPDRPRLMRRVNLGDDRAIGIGIENFQVTYDLVDGVTNPTNQAEPVAPNTAHQIRKANLFLAGRSHAQATQSRQYLRNSLSTQVSLRSLSFVDRYQ